MHRHGRIRTARNAIRRLAILIGLVFALLLPALAAAQSPHLPRFLDSVPAGDLVEGADGFGAMRAAICRWRPSCAAAKALGWVFITSDFVRHHGLCRQADPRDGRGRRRCQGHRRQAGPSIPNRSC
jgi:transcriptional regulator of nitric oxide reductase